MILIKKINEIFVKIQTTEQHLEKEIFDKFSFPIPNFYRKGQQFSWAKKRKKSLYFLKNKTFYIGLLPELIKFLKENNYEYRIEGSFNASEFSEVEALEFIKSLNLPEKFEVRDYQLKYFIKAVRNKRLICESPTSSGKSLIIYLIYRYFNENTVLVVPTINLVQQMAGDFKDYGYEEDIHCITAGVEKNTGCKLTISTWQSLNNLGKSYFSKFKVVIGDEGHVFGADSLVNIMHKIENAYVRISLTGTLNEEKLASNQITGLFGPSVKYISTKELMDRGYSSELTIKSIVLNHNRRKFNEHSLEYEDEIKYLLGLNSRNKFITNLAISLKGNTFIMVKNINHGKLLYKLITTKLKTIDEKKDIPVHLITGSVNVDEREILRKKIDKMKDSITIVSVVFATGVNIQSINNIVFTHPSKSRKHVMQSIGRGLRRNEDKTTLTLIDIGDKLFDDEYHETATLRHFNLRQAMYRKEKFKIKNYSLELNVQ